MDILAHALWTYLVFHHTNSIWLAIIMGVLPDAIWGLHFLIHRRPFWKKGNLKYVSSRFIFADKVLHSFVCVACTFGIIYMLFGSIHAFLWAWPLHILLDIPTHAKNHLPTRILWPFSNWSFAGVNWSQSKNIAFNYVALLTLYLAFFYSVTPLALVI